MSDLDCVLLQRSAYMEACFCKKVGALLRNLPVGVFCPYPPPPGVVPY